MLLVILRGAACGGAWLLIAARGTGTLAHGWPSILVAVTAGTAAFSHEYFRWEGRAQRDNLGLKAIFGGLERPVLKEIGIRCRNENILRARAIAQHLGALPPKSIRRQLVDEVQAQEFDPKVAASIVKKSTELLRDFDTDSQRREALILLALESGLPELVARLSNPAAP